MTHEEFIRNLVGSAGMGDRVKSRERNDLEYKESFGAGNWPRYAKTMAAFANNRGGYILFGIKDNPREIKGVNPAFNNFSQERFTESLNSQFAPELVWESGIVAFDGFSIGYIYTYEEDQKPVISLKSESSEKISSGDVYYRYRARSEKIKFPEMSRIIEGRAKKEREQILRLMETIRKSGNANLGIVNYSSGRFSTPSGVDISVDRRLVMKVLRKAKYIKEGSFDETNGQPVLKITGNIDLAEEVPVPDIEPDIQYPYLQKDLAEKLQIGKQRLYSLIWYYNMKGVKKYHMEVSTSASGKVHKFSDIALQFLAEKINEHKENPEWLIYVYHQFLQRNKDI